MLVGEGSNGFQFYCRSFKQLQHRRPSPPASAFNSIVDLLANARAFNNLFRDRPFNSIVDLLWLGSRRLWRLGLSFNSIVDLLSYIRMIEQSRCGLSILL